ncbi:MAG: protein-methionine-sulfoxide reductase heme-binding subunit MsrQ [Anaerolineaceae bacterium]|nr:MAG: sulfoxide reductase heme-binding subunit YedZ [Chloroflexi bacterium HGW-Chloroflexi-7]HCS41012.1 sulfoxide reductase heme-binding subunit YedZ [Anaerolineaceae bacterium]
MNKKIEWLRLLVHFGAWGTLLVLILINFLNPNSVNPILTFEHHTGKTALIFLILSLAGTPVGSILEWKDFAKRKKAFGVYGFMFAAVHLTTFLWLDYGFQFKFILSVIKNTVYIWFGLAAFTMLLAMAITSFKKMKQLMKKNWKRLHRLAYVITPLVVVHFFLIVKANLFTLQGNVQEPLIYGSIVLILLLVRIPPIKRTLINLRNGIQSRTRRTNPV